MAKTDNEEESANSYALLQLENLCQASLPGACRAVYLNYPEILRYAARAEDGTDSEGFVCDAELLADPADVLSINREVRLHSIADPEGREFFWPVAFLVIGETGDGDYYCVDASGEYEGVMQFRHHTVEFEVVADSLEEFYELLVERFVLEFDDGADDPFAEEQLDHDPRKPVADL